MIAGFTGLGKDAIGVSHRSKVKNPIQDTALNGALYQISVNSRRDLESLILFSISDDREKQYAALWALRDLVLFNKSAR